MKRNIFVVLLTLTGKFAKQKETVKNLKMIDILVLLLEIQAATFMQANARLIKNFREAINQRQNSMEVKENLKRSVKEMMNVKNWPDNERMVRDADLAALGEVTLKEEEKMEAEEEKPQQDETKKEVKDDEQAESQSEKSSQAKDEEQKPNKEQVRNDGPSTDTDLASLEDAKAKNEPEVNATE